MDKKGSNSFKKVILAKNGFVPNHKTELDCEQSLFQIVEQARVSGNQVRAAAPRSISTHSCFALALLSKSGAACSLKLNWKYWPKDQLREVLSIRWQKKCTGIKEKIWCFSFLRTEEPGRKRKAVFWHRPPSHQQCAYEWRCSWGWWTLW